MPVYHVVLFKLKPGATEDQVKTITAAAKSMVGKVPGLQKIDLGAPLAITAARAKGFDFGLVAILDSPDDIPVYATHPEHKKVLALGETLFDDGLAYDLEV